MSWPRERSSADLRKADITTLTHEELRRLKDGYEATIANLTRDKDALQTRVTAADRIVRQIASPLYHSALVLGLYLKTLGKPKTEELDTVRAASAFKRAVQRLAQTHSQAPWNDSLNEYANQLPQPVVGMRNGAAHPESRLELGQMLDVCREMDIVIGKAGAVTRQAQAVLAASQDNAAIGELISAWSQTPSSASTSRNRR